MKLEDMTFEQKIVTAAIYEDNGDPYRDVLSTYDVIDAICKLSDVYISLGIVDVSEIQE